MMGKSHVAFSAMLTAVTLPAVNEMAGLGFSPEELAVGVGIGAVAGVLPDIDHPDSFITHGVIPGSKIFGPVGKTLGYLLCIPPRIVGVGARATMNHRGGTHSLLFAVLWALLAAPIYAFVFCGIACLLSILGTPVFGIIGVDAVSPKEMFSWTFKNLPAISPLVMISVFIGYIGHLITDSMTNVPVPWPWPFSKKRFSILPKGLRVTTDSVTETKLLRPIFVLVLILAFSYNIGWPAAEQIFNKAGNEKQAEPRKHKNVKQKKHRSA